jgi:hypothetical protein
MAEVAMNTNPAATTIVVRIERSLTGAVGGAVVGGPAGAAVHE